MAGNASYVIAYSMRQDMMAQAFYGPEGKIVSDRYLAVRFDHLVDILHFVETHGIQLNRNSFISLDSEHRCRDCNP